MTSPAPSTARSSADLGARLTFIARGIREALGSTLPDDGGEHRPQADAAGLEPETTQESETWRSPDTWLRPVGAAAEAVASRIDTLAAELDPHGEGRFRPPPRAEYATARGALFAPGGPLRPLDILSAELTRSCDLLGTAATQAAQSGVIQQEDLERELRGLGRTVRAQSAALHLAATALGELAAHQLRHARTPEEAAADAAEPKAETRERPVQSAHPARELARAAAPLLASLYDGARPFPPLPAALRELEPTVPGPGEAATAARVAPSAAAPAREALPVHLDLSARDRVIAALGEPEATGNLSGLDWGTRIAANAIAVRRAAQRERLAGRGGTIIIDRLHAMDRLRPDPVSGVPSRRRFVAFDPTGPGRMIELVGDPDAADGLALYVPGTGTNLEMSHVNTEVAEHFVAAGEGRIATLVFLGGNFPQDMWIESGDPVFTLAMAPLLARFSLDVQAYIATLGRGQDADEAARLPVTAIGHSFGGAVVGTAETLGLWADRVMYVASPSAGIDVRSASQWRNRAPSVRRYSITVPGDPIELMQIRNGLRYPGTSSADIMDGVQRLDSGFFDTGEVMYGTRGHGGVFDRSSDAFWQMAEVIVGGEVVPFVGRSIVARGTAAWREFDGRLLHTAISHVRAQLWHGDGDSGTAARDAPIVVAGPGRLVDRKLSRQNQRKAGGTAPSS